MEIIVLLYISTKIKHGAIWQQTFDQHLCFEGSKCKLKEREGDDVFDTYTYIKNLDLPFELA